MSYDFFFFDFFFYYRYDVTGIRKKVGLEISPTTVVLLQELDRFNVLIKKMATTLMNLQRVR